MNQAASQTFRFIPFRIDDIIAMCSGDLGDDDREDFKQFAHVLAHVFHYEFKATTDALKNAYATLDPDADTREPFPEKACSEASFVALLKDTLEQANYEAITQEELNQAMDESSLFNLRLHVDFDEFSEVLLFCRGQSRKSVTIKRFLGLFSKTVEFTNYDRVVVFIRFKPDYVFANEDLRNAGRGITMLKLFQNVPKDDLEMLFPNTRLLMRLQDKLLIGVPAVISGGVVLSTKLGASVVLLASMIGYWLGTRQDPVELNAANLTILFAGLGALGAYLWKQFSSFKNRKLRFMQQLTKNLYFKNLDNNAGVIFRLINDAEEEECKEAILAYHFLRLSDQPLNLEQIDQKIEHWLAEQWDCVVDFEIDDAMKKLLRLGLVTCESGYYSPLPLNDALKTLDKRWDDYFSFP